VHVVELAGRGGNERLREVAPETIEEVGGAPLEQTFPSGSSSWKTPSRSMQQFGFTSDKSTFRISYASMITLPSGRIENSR
jgi:hypothetical protein